MRRRVDIALCEDYVRRAGTGRPRRVKLFATWLALVVLAVSAASAAAAEPQPDAAPQAPAVAPDPAPGAAQDSAGARGAAAPRASGTDATACPRTCAAAVRVRAAREDGQASRASIATSRRSRTAPTPQQTAARASSMMRIRALLPGDQTGRRVVVEVLHPRGGSAARAGAGERVDGVGRVTCDEGAAAVSKRVGLVLVVSVALAFPDGAAAQRSISHSCDTPISSDACQRWYTGASVSLQWTWSPLGTLLSGCQNATFTAEALVERSCTVDWPDTTITQKIWIGIDRTPPQLVGLQPGRPPNANGWFNRPVQLTFLGSRRRPPASPPAARRPMADRMGSECRSAGAAPTWPETSGSGSLPINYDATPRAAPRSKCFRGTSACRSSGRRRRAWRPRSCAPARGAKPVIVFRGRGRPSHRPEAPQRSALSLRRHPDRSGRQPIGGRRERGPDRVARSCSRLVAHAFTALRRLSGSRCGGRATTTPSCSTAGTRS